MTHRLTWSPTPGDHVAEWRHLHGRRLRSTVAAAILLAAGLGVVVMPEGSPLGALSAAIVAGLVLGALLWWRLPVLRVRRALQDGLLPTEPVELRLDASGLQLERGGWRSQLPWTAIEDVQSRRQHVFLHLSDVQAIAVPRRCLGDEGAQARFVADVRAWQDRGEVPPLASDPDEGRDHRVLRFHLHAEDYVLFARVVHARQLKQRPLGWTLLALLTGGLLLASAEPWRGPVDPGLLALMGTFAVLLAALGLAPLWYPRVLTPWLVRRGLRRSPGRMPSGEVVLGVGPAGGWMRSERGVSRFGWRELREVYSDADQVLLLFSDRLGVIVPARAFEPQTEQDELVAEIEAWRAATGWRRSKASAPERRAPEGVPDPFAPPE